MLRDMEKHRKGNNIVIDVTRRNNHVLSPSWDTINKFKDIETKSIGEERAWENFISKYLEEIDNIKANREIQKIVNLVNSLDKENRDVYLACFCTTSKYCHRFILFDKIDKLIVKKQRTLDDY